MLLKRKICYIHPMNGGYITVTNYSIIILTIQFYITIILLEYKNLLYNSLHEGYIIVIFCVCYQNRLFLIAAYF